MQVTTLLQYVSCCLKILKYRQQWEKDEDVSTKANTENTNLNISPIGMCISVLKEIILNM